MVKELLLKCNVFFFLFEDGSGKGVVFIMVVGVWLCIEVSS